MSWGWCAMRDSLSTVEVARELGVDRETVRRWVDVGVLVAGHRVKLAGFRVGNRWRVKRADLDKFIAECNPREAVEKRDAERKAREEMERAVIERVCKRHGVEVGRG